MTLTGLGFLFFFLPVVLAAYYFPFGHWNGQKRKIILFFASLGFYSLGNFKWLFLLVISILINYICVQACIRYRSLRFLGILAIIFDVMLLVFFKYINIFLGIASPEQTLIALPFGISYYTFLAISYVVDSMKQNRRTSFLDTAIYMSFFASISSGPVTQFDAFAPQLEKPFDHTDLHNITDGACRLAWGFSKKVLIADVLGYMAEECFSGGQLSLGTAWLGGIAYTLQIYFDFSGYSDMAVGTGQMFGFTLAENFNYPYAAKNISDFWRRWHMSLTQWFTKYIYIPLGGSRVSVPRHIFNLWVVWLVTGLWHGNGWTFIAWAMLHFAVQLAEKYLPLDKIPTSLSHIYTMAVVIVGWCIFGAESITSAASYLSAMFGIRCSCIFDAACTNLIKGYWCPLLAGCILAFPLYPRLCQKAKKSRSISIALDAVTIFVFIAAVIFQAGAGASAPMYTGF